MLKGYERIYHNDTWHSQRKLKSVLVILVLL